MLEWISNLSGIDAVFFGSALIGGGVFLIRLVLIFIGFGDHHDVDVAHVDVDAPDLDHDMGVGMLSFTGLTGFFMMFGLVGMAMRAEEHASPGLSIAVAFAAGLATMWAVAQALRLMYRLRSSGNIRFENAVGADGRVYLKIPANGRGQVEVAVQGRLRIFDAKAEQPVDLPTGTHIRVVRVIEGGTLVVERA